MDDGGRATQTDEALLDMAGVMLCSVRAGRMTWARLYGEPVQQTGAGIDAAVARMSGDA